MAEEEQKEHEDKQKKDYEEYKNSQQQQQTHENQTFRKRLHSFRTFLQYFYVEQNENPFQSLIGPGPGHAKTFSLTHLWYIFILSFIPVCSILSTIGFIQPYLASDNALCDWKTQRESCQSIIVVFITYRIGFSTSIFFLFTALILSKTSANRKIDGFSTLHTGFWIEKVIVVLVLSCVTFAFPPVVFDAIWIYAILLGDVVLTCIMLFLMCDFVEYLHSKALSFICRKKWVYMNVTFLVSVEYAIGMITMLSLLLVSIYTVIKMKDNTVLIAHIILITIYLSAQLLYVILQKKNELFCTIYATVFTYLLIWVTVVNWKQYIEPTHQWEAIWTPSNVTSLVLLYILVIYALVRKDERSHFYYFCWAVCRGDVIERNSSSLLDQPKEKKKKRNGEFNLNETLLFEYSSPEEILSENKENDTTHNGVVYNESFIHLFFALVSLKSTAVVTNYNLLTSEYDYLQTVKTIQSLVALYTPCVLVVILFSGYLLRTHLDKNNDPLSVGLLLKSILQTVGHVMSQFLFGVPECLKGSSLCRYVYSIFFAMVFSLACLVISPSFRKYFEKTSLFCDHVTTFGACMSHDPTFISLYRIFGTVGLFYWLLSILTIDVYPLSRLRKEIHTGCWPIKTIILFALFAFVVSLPSTYSRYWLYASLISIHIFTLFQLLCLIDAASMITKSCDNDTNVPTKKLIIGSAGLTLLLYAISIMAYVCFYVFYAHNYRCAVTRFFVSTNLVLCITASIISIHPIVKTGGLLLSAIVTSFCMYGTWSALNYNPAEKCNPLAHTLLLVESRPSRDAISMMDLSLMFITIIYVTIRIKAVSCRAFDMLLLPIFSSILKKKNDEEVKLSARTIEIMKSDLDEKLQIEKWLAECRSSSPIINNSHNKSSSSNLSFDSYHKSPLHINQPTQTIETIDTSHDKNPTREDGDRINKDGDESTYSYSFINFICNMACSYSFLLLAHWLEPVPGSGFKISLHWAIMSVKLVSSTLCIFTYIWILIVPVIGNKLR